MGRPSLFSILFLVFVVNFMFMVSDGLENAWGTFKATMFYYTGIGLILVANFVYPFPIPASGIALYGAAFLAFATLFPKVEILLFLVIPVQVRFLGMIAGAMLIFSVISQPILLPFVLMAYANYVFWVAIPTLRGTSRVLESAQRKKRFHAATLNSAEAFHTCATCKRSDVSDPRLEFRIGADGEEYCTDHLHE
jgi:hypothetical protein